MRQRHRHFSALVLLGCLGLAIASPVFVPQFLNEGEREKNYVLFSLSGKSCVGDIRVVCIVHFSGLNMRENTASVYIHTVCVNAL